MGQGMLVVVVVVVVVAVLLQQLVALLLLVVVLALQLVARRQLLRLRDYMLCLSLPVSLSEWWTGVVQHPGQV
jgi:hypothetical protein